MPVTDLLISLIAFLLLFQAAARLPAMARGRHRRRSLSGAFLCLDVAWWLRTDSGRSFLEPLGVNDLPTLLKHILAIIGICLMLKYVTDVYRDEDATTRHIRITALVQRTAARASLVTVLCLAAVFFLALDRTKTFADSPYFAGRHAGDPALALYLGPFNAYVGAAAAVCAYQWRRAARLAHRTTLRAGLTMMAAGMSILVLYAVLRTLYVCAITLYTPPAGLGTLQEQITDTLLHAGCALWLLGSITPATRVLTSRIRTLRAVIRLHRLWRDLVLTVDGIAFHRPSTLLRGHRAAAPLNTLRDVCARDDTPQIRLGRYVTEIRDATHELRRRAPADLLHRARRAAEAEGHTGRQLDAVTEAYWLKAALAAAGAPPGAPAAYTTAAGDDFASEVAWLQHVARAYRRAGPHLSATTDPQPFVPSR
ncbi:MAB_1171c family putative transporter [Streptomyces sp. NPDC088789]|uniref:MAB_1171c family putative transporter n=1 Tax=Streptomyces sp. NPDC088789 TaxID=3365899 RepID=UPI0038288F31